MGRIGVSFMDVEQAAVRLQGQGKTPTVDAVRDLLQTGSKTTITQHLKAWKIQQVDTTDQLPKALQTFVSGLWERLQQEAALKIDEAQEESVRQIQLLQQQLTEHLHANAALKSQLHKAEETSATERHAKETLAMQCTEIQQAHDKLNERHQATIQQLNDAKAEHTRLHQLATNMQANVEHYQNAVQQQRTEQLLASEKQQLLFQQEADALKQALTNAQEKTQEMAHILRSQEQELKQLHESHHQLSSNADQHLDRIQTQDRELAILGERCQQYQKTVESQNQELTRKNALEIEVAVLTDQVKGLQTALRQNEDKVETLRHEKLFLSQEKSQLKGYIEQSQSGKMPG